MPKYRIILFSLTAILAGTLRAEDSGNYVKRYNDELRQQIQREQDERDELRDRLEAKYKPRREALQDEYQHEFNTENEKLMKKQRADREAVEERFKKGQRKFMHKAMSGTSQIIGQQGERTSSSPSQPQPVNPPQ